MRFLIVGAGATGGYFGGRLLEAGADVTFLVRKQRAAELAASGLVVNSRFGDMHLRDVPTVAAEDLRERFDVVLLSSKAYDLDGAMEAFAPAVGEGTCVLPVLNGMRHLEALDRRFGRERVLGGQCLIAAGLNDKHEVMHLNDKHELAFGDRHGGMPERITRIAEAMSKARFDVRASAEIVPDMWAKWVFLASLACGTCMMRASVGEIVAAEGGSDVMRGLVAEANAIAASAGHAVQGAMLERIDRMLTQEGSTLTSSMLRDMEGGGRIEAEHVVGDLLARRESEGERISLLGTAYTHLRAYERRRGRAG